MRELRVVERMTDADDLAEIALRKFLFTIGDVEPGDDEDRILEAANAAIERLDAIEEAAQNAEVSAHSALGVAQAKQRADGGTTKKETASKLSRNELIRRLANGRGTANVTVGDIKEMAKPEVVLYQQTIEDAWDDLQSRWSCFTRTTNQGGFKVLQADRANAVPELVHAVEEDLDRDDLSKRLLRRGDSTA